MPTAPTPPGATPPADALKAHGAYFAVREGALDRPEGGGLDRVLALHVKPGVPAGEIQISPGPFTAGAYSFEVAIKGVGGHTARPFGTYDPGFVLSYLKRELPVLIADEIKLRIEAGELSSVPGRDRVLTDRDYAEADADVLLKARAVVICPLIRSGEANNVVPESGMVAGRVRSYDEKLLGLVPELVRSAVRKALADHRSGLNESERFTVLDGPSGSRARFEYRVAITVREDIPPLINDEATVDLVRSAGSAAMGDERVKPSKPSTGGDDFAYFGEYLARTGPPRAAMARLGVGGLRDMDLHRPDFDIDPQAYEVGLATLIHFLSRAQQLRAAPSEVGDELPSLVARSDHKRLEPVTFAMSRQLVSDPS